MRWRSSRTLPSRDTAPGHSRACAGSVRRLRRGTRALPSSFSLPWTVGCARRYACRRTFSIRRPRQNLGVGALSSTVLVLVFVAAAVATWIAGTALSKTTDFIDRRFGLGEALGGVVLLAVAGSPAEKPTPATGSTARALVVFGIACVVTLVAGVVLEVAGSHLADRAGINGVIFGATVLAVATALPEISSGIAAVRLGDNELAVADIFGGNAFQVCLFLVADVIAGKPVLPTAGHQNSWLAVLGIALTVIYAYGVIIRREECVALLGRDSTVRVAV